MRALVTGDREARRRVESLTPLAFVTIQQPSTTVPRQDPSSQRVFLCRHARTCRQGQPAAENAGAAGLLAGQAGVGAAVQSAGHQRDWAEGAQHSCKSCTCLLSCRRLGQPGATEFVWRRADRPAAGPPGAAAPALTSPGDRSHRLAAAADLARRCAELGVRPPLPPPPAQPPTPQPMPGHPSQQHDRLAALSQQLHQQGSLLASAVQVQTQQLAAQQALLQNVVQGLLFVSAKANRTPPAATTAPAVAPTSAAEAAVLAPAPAAVDVRSEGAQPGSQGPAPGNSSELDSPARRTAALVHGLAGRLHAVGEGGGDVHPAATCGNAGNGGSPPCGVLRVPLLAQIGSAAPLNRQLQGECLLPGSRQANDTNGLSQRAAVAVQPPAASQNSGSSSMPARGLHSTGGVRQLNRPAWDDRTVIVEPRGGAKSRRDSRPPPAPPPRRTPGGLAPHLLLQELKRLQRRRSTGGSLAERSGQGGNNTRAARRTQQAAALPPPRHPLTAPAEAPAASTAWQPPPSLFGRHQAPSAGRLRFQRAKEAAAVGRAGQHPAQAPGANGGGKGSDMAPAPAETVSQEKGALHQCAGAAHPPSPSLVCLPTAPGGAGTMAHAGQPGTAGGCYRAALVEESKAVPAELSNSDVEAICDRLCREVLLRECAPCVPFVGAE